MLPANRPTRAATRVLEPLLVLVGLIATVGLTMAAAQVSRDVLENLRLVVQAGAACLGRPDWAC